MKDQMKGYLRDRLSSSLFARRSFVTTALASTAAVLSPMVGTASTVARRAAILCPKVPTPMRDVGGKVAFVTGGSSGIGLGISQAFAEAGMNVALGYRTKAHLDEALRSLQNVSDQIHAISVDVTDRAGMERAAAETVKVFGKIHVLVNNAGVSALASLGMTTYDDWDWVVGVNLTGVFNGVHAFLPYIRAHSEGGQIIAGSSAAGLFCAGSAAGAYTVSKFGVVAMMEALRVELAEHNIGASVYCPGSVGSNIVDSDRNRPEKLADVGVTLDAKAKNTLIEQIHDPQLSITPLEMGRLVLRGMRNNDLYILSHPEYKPLVDARNEALIASFPRDLHATRARLEASHALLEKSIYLTERNRHLCALHGQAELTAPRELLAEGVK